MTLGLEQSGIGVAVDPTSGTILTAKPTALVFSADNVTPVVPTNVQAFLPVNTGALTTRYPSSGYQGTAYSALGIERLKVISVNDWRDTSNSANMNLMAYEFLTSLQDLVYEGSMPYYGLLSSALTIGSALNITGNGYSTGWETIAIPITAVDLEYCERSGATNYVTTLTFGNRRQAFNGAVLQRPSVTGQPFGLGGGGGSLGATIEAVGSLAETAGAVDAGIASQAGAVGSEIDRQSAMATPDLGSVPTSLQDLGVPTSVDEVLGG